LLPRDRAAVDREGGVGSRAGDQLLRIGRLDGAPRGLQLAIVLHEERLGIGEREIARRGVYTDEGRAGKGEQARHRGFDFEEARLYSSKIANLLLKARSKLDYKPVQD